MNVEARHPPAARQPIAPGLWEVVGGGIPFAVAAAAILFAYSRSRPEPLYNTGREGLANGAGRVLVFLGFPTALWATAALVIVYVVGRRTGIRSHWFRAAVVVAAGLCATAAVPGVVNQSDLDARPVNALAGAGVALACVLTAVVAFRGGLGRPAPWAGADGARAALAGLALLLALPWVAAEIGIASPDARLLREVFLDYDRRPREPGTPPVPAVHAGDHHGMDGVLLLLGSLTLSRAVALLRRSALRALLVIGLSLGMVYGLSNAVQDAWNEQLLKRETVSWSFPSVLEPSPSPPWGLMLAATAALASAWEYRLRKGPLR